MASMPQRSPTTFWARSGKRRDGESPARIDLRAHVRHAHWSVQTQNWDAAKEQLGNVFSNDLQRADRIQQLIVHEIPQLRRYARFLVRDPQAADDLVQDTLVRAVAAIDSWQTDSNMRAWLLTIMKNIMRNDFRRARNAHIYLGHEFDRHPGIAVQGNQEPRVALLDLQRALNELPDEYQQVLLLSALDGLRYEEMAMILDVPIGTVRSRLSRGRLALWSLMDGTRAPAKPTSRPTPEAGGREMQCAERDLFRPAPRMGLDRELSRARAGRGAASEGGVMLESHDSLDRSANEGGAGGEGNR